MEILYVFLAFALLFTAAYAIGLLYHWIRFGWLYPWVWVAIPIYGGGVFVLFSVMFGALALT